MTMAATPDDDDDDRISSLPDELLHSILVRLPSTADAARTSVLSRRWRRVWAHLPALVFTGQPGLSAPDAVDAALSAYSAPCLLRFAITISGVLLPGVPAARACAWLRFAARRLAGDLALRILLETVRGGGDTSPRVVELPPCDRVTTIDISITAAPERFVPDPLLRLPPAPGASCSCAFAALRVLKIEDASLVYEDLRRVVSEQSPCLQELELRHVAAPPAAHVDLCIRSASLQRIVLWCLKSTVGRLVVSASRLLYLHLRCCRVRDSISVAAPALSELIWDVMPGAVYANSTDITEAGRHVSRLETWCCPVLSRAALFQQFHTVDELCLHIPSITDMNRYNHFIEETDRLPKAKILQVHAMHADNHGFAAMLHLLIKCGQRLETLKITTVSTGDPLSTSACTRFVESCRINDITLSSLQEIEIDYSSEDEHVYGLLKILFMGCKMSPRRLAVCPRGRSSKPLTGRTHEYRETRIFVQEG